MLWEKIMLGQILKRPGYEPHFTAESPETWETKALPAFMAAHDGSSRAIFERVRDRFLR